MTKVTEENRENGKPVRDFRDAWAKVRAEAGVTGLLFHDLRRTAVRNMVKDRTPEKVAMTITGHRTRSVFDRYHIVDATDKKLAAQRMEERARSEAANAPANFEQRTNSTDSVTSFGRASKTTPALN